METKVYTDASAVGLGALLTQVQKDGRERVVIYSSKTLTKTERIYPQIQREAVAIVWALEKFSHYLLGREFLLVTDNLALKQIYSSEPRDSKRAVMRFEGWHLRLAPFRFKVQHIAGKDNVATDALSRICSLPAKPYEENREVLELGKVKPQINALSTSIIGKTITLESVREQTQLDDVLQAVIKALKTGSWGSDIKHMKPFADEFFIKDGLLLRGCQIVLPESLRQQTLINAHVAHSGIVVMKRSLRSAVWWPRLDKDVITFVQRCLGCTAIAKDDHPEPMIRTVLPHRAMDFVAVDHWSASIVPVKLLVVTDYYSRYLWVKLVKNGTSMEAAEACEDIFKVFGKPKTLRADNGTAFSSEEFKNWCSESDIKLDFSVPLWPQHNGQVENAMKFINKTLRIARINKENWKASLEKAIGFYNNLRVHTVTGVTPAEMMFGRKLRETMPLINVDMTCDVEEIRDVDIIEKWKSKETADKRRNAKVSDIQIGDTVFMRSKGDDKLSARFDITKPCKVILKEGITVTVMTEDGRTFLRNVTALKKDYHNETLDENKDVSGDQVTPEETSMDTDEGLHDHKFFLIFLFS